MHFIKYNLSWYKIADRNFLRIIREKSAGEILNMYSKLQDEYNPNHSTRMWFLAFDMAKKFNFTDEAANAVSEAASYHDLGFLCYPIKDIIFRKKQLENHYILGSALADIVVSENPRENEYSSLIPEIIKMQKKYEIAPEGSFLRVSAEIVAVASAIEDITTGILTAQEKEKSLDFLLKQMCKYESFVFNALKLYSIKSQI